MNWLVFAAVFIPTSIVLTRWALRHAVEKGITEGYERCGVMVGGFQCERRQFHRGRCR